jgi:two-component system chemotaxis response regulator CheB
MDGPLELLRSRSPAVVAIGGSAGSLDALRSVLAPLPASLPVPVVVIVHLSADRESGLVPALAAFCRLAVCEVEDKMPARPGRLYVGPADYHVLLETDGAFALSVDEPVHYSRPSIDVCFHSVAEAFGPRAVGLLLSGASADGAEGLSAMRANGAVTWVQDPASAAVPLMPRAALALAPHTAMTPEAMGQVLGEWGRHGG